MTWEMAGKLRKQSKIDTNAVTLLHCTKRSLATCNKTRCCDTMKKIDGIFIVGDYNRKRYDLL